MTAEQSKARREKRVFNEFLQKSGLPIDRDSVENRRPPEPDILCRHNEQGSIAFELVELCESDIANTISKSTRSVGINAVFMWNADPTEGIIRKKLEKEYETEHPIELLCYTAGNIVTPDEQIIETIVESIDKWGLGSFRRVWLLGEEVCQKIFPL